MKRTNIRPDHECGSLCAFLNSCYSRFREFDEIKHRLAKEENKPFNPGRPDFMDVTREHGLFQIPSAEWIAEIRREITRLLRNKFCYGNWNRKAKIVEIGAGTGWLTDQLQKAFSGLNRFREIKEKPEFVAVDNNESPLVPDLNSDEYGVRVDDWGNVVADVEPDIVLTCWRPMGSEWIPTIYDIGVPAVIMIGEGRGGCVGSPPDWETDYRYKSVPGITQYGIARTDHFFTRADGHLRQTKGEILVNPEMF